MIDDAAWRAWLSRPGAERELIVQLHHADGVERVARRGLATLPSDPLPNTIIRGLLNSNIEISSGFDSQLSIGSLELVNTGELDGWLHKKWFGYPVDVLLGDPSWLTSDYRQVAVATNGGISTADKTTLEFTLQDGAAALDVPVLTAKTPDGVLIPRCFGEPKAITPILIDAAQLVYQVSIEAVDSVVVKDNGAVVSQTSNTAAGTFTLSQAKQGTITVDVVDSTTRTAASIISAAGAAVGLPVDIAALATLPTYTLGLFVSGDTTWRTVLDEACRSIGAFWWVTEQGVITAARFAEPAATPDHVIPLSAIVENSLQCEQVEQPVSDVQLHYGRRHTTLSTVAGVLDEAERDRLGKPWDVAAHDNALVGFKGALPLNVETAITHQADAMAEAQQRGSLKATQRYRYSLTTTVAGAQYQVGQTVQITHPRWSLEGGQRALIIGLRKQLAKSAVEMEVWF